MIRGRRGDPEEGLGRCHIGRSAFLLVLGLSFTAAFLSLSRQVIPLFGESGIAPIEGRLAAIAVALGDERFLQIPSLLWWSASDQALRLLCWSGCFLSLLLAFGVLVPVVLPLLFVLYLSFVTAGAPFLSFQWDSLLLEAAFLACFLIPTTFWPSRSDEPEPWKPAVWILRLLLVKLMLSSGLAKLTSADPSWRDLSAMSHHFMTQPLPSPLAWWLHQLPMVFHRVCSFLVLAIELLAPLLVFGPRRFRHMAAAILIGFQVAIVLTGGFGFFNLLSIGLCFLLFDDAAWPWWIRQLYYTNGRGHSGPMTTLDFWSRVFRAAIFVPFALLMVIQVVRAAGGPRLPEPVPTVLRTISPLHIANPYGLFAVMTTERRELVFEGSGDGNIWEPYSLPYKPGDPRRTLPVVRWCHMPRLDWQLWFAAFGGNSEVGGVERTVEALLEGRPEVLSLFDENPFPNTPPRFLRVNVWDYRFTTLEERRTTGDWWVRENERVLVPGVMLTPR